VLVLRAVGIEGVVVAGVEGGPQLVSMERPRA
jgi:hypothetical protein